MLFLYIVVDSKLKLTGMFGGGGVIWVSNLNYCLYTDAFWKDDFHWHLLLIQWRQNNTFGWNSWVLISIFYAHKAVVILQNCSPGFPLSVPWTSTLDHNGVLSPLIGSHKHLDSSCSWIKLGRQHRSLWLLWLGSNISDLSMCLF